MARYGRLGRAGSGGVGEVRSGEVVAGQVRYG